MTRKIKGKKRTSKRSEIKGLFKICNQHKITERE